MATLYVYTLFGSKGRPRCTALKIGSKVLIYDLYRPGANKSLRIIWEREQKIKRIFVAAHEAGSTIVTSDFRAHLKAFKLPQTLKNIYDLHLPDIAPTATQAKDYEIVRNVIEKMVGAQLLEYQRILANSAYVYAGLEQNGLWYYHQSEYTNDFYETVHPIWSQRTYSGRAKTTGFNIQGFTEEGVIRARGYTPNDVLLYFDWICADIRVASLLSHDARLADSFKHSDPYTEMMTIINNNTMNTTITRLECKQILLKAINSMDIDNPILDNIYPGLVAWISRCSILLREQGYLKTLLGRKFKLKHAKNNLAVLNGVMQGSVAHGMQRVINKVWDCFSNSLVADIHDSLVIAAPADNKRIRVIIDQIIDIMLHPFAGILETNPSFPVQVSLGRKWRKWHNIEIHRESGVTRVKTKTVGSGQETQAQTQD